MKRVAQGVVRAVGVRERLKVSKLSWMCAWLSLSLSVASQVAAQAGEPAPCRQPCGRFLLLEPALGVGAQLAATESRYEVFSREDGSDHTTSHRAVGLAFEHRLAASGFIGEHVALGGFLGIGNAPEPPPAADDSNRVVLLTFGPQLSVAQARYRGFYATLRGGLAWEPEGEHTGLAAALGAGYFLQLFGSGALGFGAELAGRWHRESEDGDHGTYRYATQLWTPAAVVTLRVM